MSTLMNKLCEIIDNKEALEEPKIREALKNVFTNLDNDFNVVEFQQSGRTDKAMEGLLSSVASLEIETEDAEDKDAEDEDENIYDDDDDDEEDEDEDEDAYDGDDDES